MSTRDTNFGTYYQLNVDHVIVNGGIKEFIVSLEGTVTNLAI